MCARRLSVFPFHNKMTRTSLTEFASLTAEQREAVFSCRHERKDAVGRDGETGKEKKRMKKEEEEKCSPRPRCVLTGCAGGSVLRPPTHSDCILFTFSATLEEKGGSSAEE